MFQKLNLAPKSWKFIYLPSVGSTNAYAKGIISNTNPLYFTAVFTDHQTDGKGQYDRKWVSETNKNLLCSLLIPMKSIDIPHNDVFRWNMYIAVAIRQVLQSYIEETIYIKWPNDLIIRDKKLGGILIENIYSGQSMTSSIIGVGININQNTFDESLPDATSLVQIDQTLRNPTDILYAITNMFNHEGIGSINHKNPDLIMNLYNKYLYKVGKTITIMDADEIPMQAVLKGVLKDGNMEVQVDQTHLKLSHGQYRMVL